MTAAYRNLFAPSILAADFAQLGQQLAECAAGGADLIHCDVMDGHFVDAISFGADICAAAAAASKVPLDVHLMVDDVAGQVGQVLGSGPRYVTFHYESPGDPLVIAQQIRAGGAAPGLAINPATPLAAIDEIADQFDLLLVMTVVPGAAGQAFIEGCLGKVAAAAALREQTGANYRIEVDGGVAAKTIASCARAGADTFVAGSAVFSAPAGIGPALAQLRALASR